MGMFDTVYKEITCPNCGETKVHDIQFKVYVGKYDPFLGKFHIGQRMPINFPLADFDIKERLYFDGWNKKCNCELTDEQKLCIIQFRFGFLKDVIYPIPNNYVIKELPISARRKRIEEARSKRHHEEYEKATAGMLPMNKIAYALAGPLRVNLDYAGIFRSCVSVGNKLVENYYKDDNGWHRKKYKGY